MSPSMSKEQKRSLKLLAALGNPTRGFQYHYFLEELVKSGSGKLKVSGKVINHFAVIEENEALMLHIRSLL